MMGKLNPSRRLGTAFNPPTGSVDKVRALVIEPDFAEIAFPLPGEGKYVNLSDADMARIRSDAYFMKDYTNILLKYVLYSLGVGINPEGKVSASVTDPVMFDFVLNTPTYSQLFDRMVRSSAILAPQWSEAIQEVFVQYVQKRAEAAGMEALRA